MFFHQKKYKNLFEGVMDFHNHILPGIDDGSQSLEESLEMLDMYAVLGIEQVMASPHIYRDLYPNTAKSINNSYSLFEEASKNHQVSLIGYAAEYMIDEFFLSDVSSQKKLIKCFSDYILVEIPFFGSIEILNQALFALQTKGYIPILAHPERYNSLKTIEEVKKIKRKGAMLQLNALSIVGFYGKETQKKARLWLTNGLYDFVCTDAHNVNQLKKLEEIRLSKKELKAWKIVCEKHHQLTNV
jgi:protein-tyrosine phosphatase